MYHDTIIDKRLTKLADHIRSTVDPRFEFREYSIPEVEEWCEYLASAWDESEQAITSPLNVEAEAFIRHELNRCKVDFNYWARRYAFLKDKRMSLIRYNPTAVQSLLLRRIAEEELKAVSGTTGDGILLNVLKARQLGISTVSEIIISHRTFFYGNSTALIAADVEERLPNLFEMLVRVLDNLPWWMKPRSADPTADYRVKNKQLFFRDQDSTIRLGCSSNMAGGEKQKDKGSIGTGQTFPLVHLSELALWQNAGQIEDSLMPSIPLSPRTFAIFESTAKGRANWWHHAWEKSKKNIGRMKPVFIPWYTDPNTYTKPAPVDYVPSETATGHAERVRRTSEYWVGHPVSLTRDQLYWWEGMRADYAYNKQLYKFVAEYAADDMEAFQNPTSSVFGADLIEELRNKANADPIIIDIRPRMQMP